MQVRHCVLKKEKREGGLEGGRSASPQSRMTILIFTSKAAGKNICICAKTQRRPPKAE